MAQRTAITVSRPREGVERLWETPDYRPDYIDDADVAVTFSDAPGDRGTEIHVDLGSAAPGGKLAEMVSKLTGGEPRAKVMDDLRRFKQQVETGVIARSDAVPEGELAERKLGQRPAQPLDEAETQKAEA
jgi:nucleoside-diphosphate-sugar epimerase